MSCDHELANKWARCSRKIASYSGVPIFGTSKGNENWFEKSGVKLQCSTEEGKQLLVRVIGRFDKMRVREIGIPLYITISIVQLRRSYLVLVLEKVLF